MSSADFCGRAVFQLILGSNHGDSSSAAVGQLANTGGSTGLVVAMASLIQAPGPCGAFGGHQLHPGLGYLVPGSEGKSLPLAEL